MSVYSLKVEFGSVSMVTASLGANDPEVGQTRRVGDEDYIFVYNAGNSQISKGLGATVSGVSGYSVTVSSTAGGVDPLIGVCVHSTLTTGTYGWLLQRGFGTFKAHADHSFAAGDRLMLAADGAFGNPVSISNVSNTQNIFAGKVMVAAASGTTSGVGYFCI